MANSRADLRSRIMKELGLWLRPFRDLIRPAALPSLPEYNLAYGKLAADKSKLLGLVTSYLNLGDDINMTIPKMQAYQMFDMFWLSMQGPLKEAKMTGDLEKIKKVFAVKLEAFEQKFEALLDLVPVDWEPELISAQTPYRAYLRIKSVLESAKYRIHYFDRYLNQDFFTLYLPDIKRSMEIRLITTTNGVKRVQAASNLAQQEFSDYQLIEVHQNHMHDRNLRIDDMIFSLGTGVSDAGVKPTNFTPSENSPSAHDQLNKLIAGGTVIH